MPAAHPQALPLLHALGACLLVFPTGVKITTFGLKRKPSAGVIRESSCLNRKERGRRKAEWGQPGEVGNWQISRRAVNELGGTELPFSPPQNSASVFSLGARFAGKPGSETDSPFSCLRGFALTIPSAWNVIPPPPPLFGNRITVDEIR